MAVICRISELHRSNPMSFCNEWNHLIGRLKMPVNRNLPGDKRQEACIYIQLSIFILNIKTIFYSIDLVLGELLESAILEKRDLSSLQPSGQSTSFDAFSGIAPRIAARQSRRSPHAPYRVSKAG
ncbi:hypothetical protein [Pantoea sp. 18069]|uniref:hypothetical protein n=1 Tax=Pantoea sp. 18069 TaxID=2681415 RepID=UPI00135A87A6|nr:hypothetical protein [Pantoea sp. 18069]